VTAREPVRGRQVLIVVDVQEGFVTPETTATVPLVAAHVRERRGHYAGVLATRFINEPGSLYETERDWHELMPGPTTRLLPAVEDHADVVLTKHGLAPHHDELLAALRRLEVDRVELCGFDTDQCVLATALQLWDCGIAPRVLAPLCSSSGGQEMHLAGLAMLRRAIGDRNVTDEDGRPI
jgi:nicotinamidase-related amidase